jgi:hypothetical protein
VTVVARLARFVVAQSWDASCKPVRQQVDELETRDLMTLLARARETTKGAA